MSASSGEGGQAKPLDALPKVFVDSMRTLFDIMDDKRTGFVHYSGETAFDNVKICECVSLK